MIDLYYAPTPNTWKASIMLEECGLPYRLIPVDIMAGEQKRPEFLAINPNGRIPAIVDHEAVDGPQAVFESGAILLYLADKTGRFLASLSSLRTAGKRILSRALCNGNGTPLHSTGWSPCKS